MQKTDQKGFIQAIFLAITLLIIFLIIFAALVTSIRTYREGNMGSMLDVFIKAFKK